MMTDELAGLFIKAGLPVICEDDLDADLLTNTQIADIYIDDPEGLTNALGVVGKMPEEVRRKALTELAKQHVGL